MPSKRSFSSSSRYSRCSYDDEAKEEDSSSSFSSCSSSSGSEEEEEEDCDPDHYNHYNHHYFYHKRKKNTGTTTTTTGHKKKKRTQQQHDEKKPPAAAAGVYVLRSKATGVCYVGKSNDMESRIAQHRSSSNNDDDDVLTRERTITFGSVDDLESWERNEVLTRMYSDGEGDNMDGVRGWRYTRRGKLTTDERISARDDIVEKFDLCRRCGRIGHFADRCFARSPAIWCKDIPM